MFIYMYNSHDLGLQKIIFTNIQLVIGPFFAQKLLMDTVCQMN